jgi:hypothetical protein
MDKFTGPKLVVSPQRNVNATRNRPNVDLFATLDQEKPYFHTKRFDLDPRLRRRQKGGFFSELIETRLTRQFRRDVAYGAAIEIVDGVQLRKHTAGVDKFPSLGGKQELLQHLVRERRHRASAVTSLRDSITHPRWSNHRRTSGVSEASAITLSPWR